MATLNIVQAKNVKTRNVDWLIAGLIPQNRLSIIDGDPGQGKSYITLEIAAALSRGQTITPKGRSKDGARAAMNVFILNAEDDPDSTMVPRLKFLKADMNRIYFGEQIIGALPGRDGVMHKSRGLYLPTDATILAAALEQLQIGLLIVDPVMAFIAPDVATNSDQAVRHALACLKTMCQEHGITCILVRHLNKKSDGKVLYRGGGSIGIIGLTRAAVYIGPNPENREQKVFAQVKNNLGPLAKPWLFKMQTNAAGERSIRWEGEADIPLSRIQEAAKEKLPLEIACEFLTELLTGVKDGMGVQDVFARGNAKGITNCALKRAKTELGVTSMKVHSAWRWYLGVDVKQNLFDRIKENAE
jgi:AAA domain